MAYGVVSGRPLVSNLRLGKRAAHKKWVILVTHEFSRTGAPYIALELLREISKTHNVLSVGMKKGPLKRTFLAESNLLLMPGVLWRLPRSLGLLGINPRSVEFMVFNSVESVAFSKLVRVWKGTNKVALVHEFMSGTPSASLKSAVLDDIGRVIFPSEQTELDSRLFLSPETRSMVEVQPVRSLEGSEEKVLIGELPKINVSLAHGGKKVILGAGWVSFRKGVDLFIEVARSVEESHPGEFVFLWCGEGYDPEKDFYSKSLKLQIAYSQPAPPVYFIGHISLKEAFDHAHALLIPSRLDPHPNVGLEALSCGVPVVTFEKAVGSSELLRKLGLNQLIAPYCDTDALGRIVVGLTQNKLDFDEKIQKMSRGSWANYWHHIKNFALE